MAKNSIDQQIQLRINQFAEELGALVKAAALESVSEALGGTAKASVSAAGPRRKKTARRAVSAAKPGKRFRRTAEHLEGDKQALLDYVTANAGQRLEEISAGMNVDSKELKRPATLLLQEGKLRKEGERRGTRYFAGGRGAGKAGPTKRKKKKSKSKKR